MFKLFKSSLDTVLLPSHRGTSPSRELVPGELLFIPCLFFGHYWHTSQWLPVHSVSQKLANAAMLIGENRRSTEKFLPNNVWVWCPLSILKEVSQVWKVERKGKVGWVTWKLQYVTRYRWMFNNLFLECSAMFLGGSAVPLNIQDSYTTQACHRIRCGTV